jgi:hypothetical protein
VVGSYPESQNLVDAALTQNVSFHISVVGKPDASRDWPIKQTIPICIREHSDLNFPVTEPVGKMDQSTSISPQDYGRQLDEVDL